ncbi:MAG: hypothetical protein AMXMBFR81_23080 [Chthonomonas sp.]
MRVPATPTLLLPIGGVGNRIVANVWERLEFCPIRTSGSIRVVSNSGALGPAIERELVLALGSRTLERLPPEPNVRISTLRLKLQMVCVAAICEAPVERLIEALHGFCATGNPEESTGILFLLDVSNPARPAQCAPELTQTLGALKQAAQEACSNFDDCGRIPPELRFLVLHPRHWDGSFLEHSNIKPSAHVPRVAVRVALREPPDDFESAIAAALHGHLVTGPTHGALAETRGAREFDFALAGWAGSVFPRDLLLQSVAKLIASLVLTESCVPNADGQSKARQLKEGLLESLTRESLVRSILQPVTQDVVVADSVGTPVHKSRFQRLVERVIGAVNEDVRVGINVLMRVNPRFESDFRTWPAGIVQADQNALPQYEQNCRAVQERQRAIVVRLIEQIVAGSDSLVRSVPGGSQLARDVLESVVRKCKNEQARRAPVFVSSSPAGGDGEVGHQSDLQGLLSHLHRRCQSHPGWQAAVARSVALGALAAPLTYAFAWPMWAPLAGILVGMLAFGSLAVFSFRRLVRLRDQVVRGVEEKYGNGIYNAAQSAVGDEVAGVYRQVVDFVEQWEQVIIRRFDDERSSAIQTAIQLPEWPDGFNLSTDLLEEDDPAALFRIVRATLSDEAVKALQQRELDNELFSKWRYPDMASIVSRLVAVCRSEWLQSFEYGAIGAGDLRETLFRFKLKNTRESIEHYQRWFVDRMDRMALRSLPKAVSWSHDPKGRQGFYDCVVRYYVPKSWRWHRCYEPVEEFGKPIKGPSPTGLPAQSHAETVRAQFDPEQTTDVWNAEESDVCAGIVLLNGLEIDDIARAMRIKEAMG